VREGELPDFAALEAAGMERCILYVDPPTDLDALERVAQALSL
jgi:hypothetical protein